MDTARDSLRWFGTMAIIGALAASLVAAVGSPTTAGAVTPTPIAPSADWLATLDHYRAMAGLAPVTDEPAWTEGERAHARYMITNAAVSHDEVPSTPGYSEAGDAAANNGNVTVSSESEISDRAHIEEWIRGPFHAIGLLRPSLRRSAYGSAVDPTARPWRSAATMDVLRGVDRSAPRPATPVLFPGEGTTTALSTLSNNESPDPRSFCGWTGAAGLPVLAMFPTDPGSASATIEGPGGPVEVCLLGAANTNGLAQQILRSENAVTVIPRVPLTAGRYTVRITTRSAGTVSWSFTVDPSVASDPGPAAPLPQTAPTASPGRFVALPPARLVDTRRQVGADRLRAATVTRLDVAGRAGVPTDATAVSVNLTAVDADAGGYLTAFPCGTAVPEVSSLNFTADRATANAALLPLDASGDVCVMASAGTDLLVDVNGAIGPSGSAGFVPVEPVRLLDTRRGLGSPTRVTAGSTVRLTVRGGAGIPSTANAVALTVTAVAPSGGASPYVTAFPCGPRPEVSNLNLRAGETRPNLVVVPIAADGSVCLFTTVETDLLADLAGYFAPGVGRVFTPLAPVRLLDTRQADGRVNGGSGGRTLGTDTVVRVKVAGQRGIPSGIVAVSANVTVTGAAGSGFATAFPCAERPEASNLNFVADADIAGAAPLVLDADGAACLYVSAGAHVLVDVNGAW